MNCLKQNKNVRYTRFNFYVDSLKVFYKSIVFEDVEQCCANDMSIGE